MADEADNLRAALGCFLDRGDAEAGLALAARIHHLWFLRGPRAEGQAWLARLLALPAPVPPPSRAAAVFAAGWLAQFQGDLAEAQAAYTQAATLAQARGDRAGQAYAQTQHARVEGAARGLLGEDAFAALRTEGRRLRLEEVARLALAQQEPHRRAPADGQEEPERF